MLFLEEHKNNDAPAVDRQPGLRREDSLVGAQIFHFFGQNIDFFDIFFKFFSPM